VLVIRKLLDQPRLLPSITEDKNVVSCDAEHDENDQLVQCRNHANLENSRVNELAYGERQQD